MGKTVRKQNVFISFKESNEKSEQIVEQFKKFFNEWNNLNYSIVRSELTKGKNREDTVQDCLNKSTCFLQILTDHKESDWLTKELYWAQMIKLKIFVLYTNDADRKTIDSLKNERLDIYEIIDEKNCQRIFKEILFLNKRLPKKCGKIELPDCCLKPQKQQIEIDRVKEFISNFYEASMRGLIGVYPNRDSVINSLEKRFEKLSSEKGEIRMLGFTLRRYVMPYKKDEKGNEQENKIGRLFESAITNGVNAKMLLLSKNCYAAKERTKIENEDKVHKQSDLVIHSNEVSSKYLSYKNVKIKYYETPYTGMIIFDDEVYVELYHLGKEIKDKNLCGHVPILLIKKGQEEGYYDLFEHHFDNIWKKSKK
ncbi:MAG: hypothetical protein AB1498_12385 [bacterium]